jgi:hypothetical protein
LYVKRGLASERNVWAGSSGVSHAVTPDAAGKDTLGFHVFAISCRGALPLCLLHDRTLHSQFSTSLQNLQQVRAGKDAFQVAVGHNR